MHIRLIFFLVNTKDLGEKTPIFQIFPRYSYIYRHRPTWEITLTKIQITDASRVTEIGKKAFLGPLIPSNIFPTKYKNKKMFDIVYVSAYPLSYFCIVLICISGLLISEVLKRCSRHFGEIYDSFCLCINSFCKKSSLMLSCII